MPGEKDGQGSGAPPPGKRIEVCKNGPYRVHGGIPLSVQRITLDDAGFSETWKEEEKYRVEHPYILCRCGRSRTLPFCDHFHEEIHFIGTEHAGREPYLEQAKEYIGPDLVLTDAEILCAIAKFCERAGGIWKLTLESGNREAREIAIQEAGNCPSGRLVVWNKESRTPIEPQHEPSIGLVEYPQEGLHGPVWVRGGIPVISAEGEQYEIRNRQTLCRCGHSFNKPFCDSSHLRYSSRSIRTSDVPSTRLTSRP
ncbi:MAG TPA: CDGSH iron-sulfur domain-containing protein [Methanomicrobiales archaeon]|nr:CDGSH iron-sulfur domain-containing protein [Methanomicrobiales archaeon]